MKSEVFILGAVLLGSTLAVTGCGPEPTTSGGSSPDIALPSQSAMRWNEEIGPVTEEDLASGLAVMQPRLLSTDGGLGEIETLQNHRYLMHPALEQPAKAVFDITGLSSVTLSPLISDFSSDARCASDPEAGVISFAWDAGEGARGQVRIDRYYIETIEIDLRESQRLQLTVDAGNDTVVCDWFVIGFLDVR